jgi:hypothetical protein
MSNHTTAAIYSDGSPRNPWLAGLSDRDLAIVLARHGGPALASASLEAEFRKAQQAEAAREYGRLARAS